MEEKERQQKAEEKERKKAEAKQQRKARKLAAKQKRRAAMSKTYDGLSKLFKTIRDVMMKVGSAIIKICCLPFLLKLTLFGPGVTKNPLANVPAIKESIQLKAMLVPSLKDIPFVLICIGKAIASYLYALLVISLRLLATAIVLVTCPIFLLLGMVCKGLSDSFSNAAYKAVDHELGAHRTNYNTWSVQMDPGLNGWGDIIGFVIAAVMSIIAYIRILIACTLILVGGLIMGLGVIIYKLFDKINKLLKTAANAAANALFALASCAPPFSQAIYLVVTAGIAIAIVALAPEGPLKWIIAILVAAALGVCCFAAALGGKILFFAFAFVLGAIVGNLLYPLLEGLGGIFLYLGTPLNWSYGEGFGSAGAWILGLILALGIIIPHPIGLILYNAGKAIMGVAFTVLPNNNTGYSSIMTSSKASAAAARASGEKRKAEIARRNQIADEKKKVMDAALKDINAASDKYKGMENFDLGKMAAENKASNEQSAGMDVSMDDVHEEDLSDATKSLGSNLDNLSEDNNAQAEQPPITETSQLPEQQSSEPIEEVQENVSETKEETAPVETKEEPSEATVEEKPQESEPQNETSLEGGSVKSTEEKILLNWGLEGRAHVVYQMGVPTFEANEPYLSEAIFNVYSKHKEACLNISKESFDMYFEKFLASRNKQA